MASFSGTHTEGTSPQGQGFAASHHDSSVHGECGMPTFHHQQMISIYWTADEEAKLQEGMAKYASESSIIRYAKIAALLNGKTARDVALRCRWMTLSSFPQSADFRSSRNMICPSILLQSLVAMGFISCSRSVDIVCRTLQNKQNLQLL